MEHEKLSEKPTRGGREVPLLLDESTLTNRGLFDGTSFYLPTLTFLSGNALGKEMPLTKQQLTLGRGEEADIMIADPSVSRRHIQLTCRRLLGKDGSQSLKVVLRDLGSKNGTMVNYRRVRQTVLRPGDKIFLGDSILKFEHRDLADRKFYDEIYRLATTDHLTSLLNKGTITRILLDEISKQDRYRRQLSVLLVDIDHFKNVNDMYGHLMGDKALQIIGRTLHKKLRKQDRAGRFGGDEFLVVLPETGLKGAAALSERIRRDIEQHTAAELGLDQKVTSSIGVAISQENDLSTANLLQHVDSALQRAKTEGKNRVVIWNQPSTRGDDS